MVDAIPEQTPLVALLCLGDVDHGAVLPVAPIFGQPLLHHIVKQLERLRISRFFIGVDSVSGALLSYGDRAKQSGLDVKFVREPQALAAEISPETSVLVLRVDTLWSSEMLGKAIAEQRPLIATVEERSENQNFERIDLNHRWPGLAILERRSLDALTALPDGWDMASALLRQALQDKCRLWPIHQSELQAGNIRKLNDEADLLAAQAMLVPILGVGSNSLENSSLMPMVSRLMPSVWSVPWGRSLVEWLFPVTALSAAAFALVNLPIAAVIAAVLAIFAASLRDRVHSVEYRQQQNDAIGVAGWVLLVMALVSGLRNPAISWAEAVFLGLALAGVSLIDAAVASPARTRLLSPLVIALSMVPGIVAGKSGGVVQGLILLGLGVSIYRLKKGDKTSETSNRP